MLFLSCTVIESLFVFFQELLLENQQLRNQLMMKQKELATLGEQQKMLEHQLHVYQDDFKHERDDKQRAQKLNAELNEQIRRISAVSELHSAVCL